MAIGAAQGLNELLAFGTQFQRGRAAGEAVHFQRPGAEPEVHRQVGGFLFAHGRARHATGRPAVQRVAQKFDEVGMPIFVPHIAQRNVPFIILSIRRMALGAPEGLVQLLAFGAVANHGRFRPRGGIERYQIMTKGFDGFGFVVLVQAVKQIGHEGAGLELLRIQHPMPQPTGRGGIVRGEKDWRGSALEAMGLAFARGMAGDAVEFGDEHLAGGNLCGRRVARETIKTGHHRLGRRPKRQAQCDDRRDSHYA